VIAGAFDDRDRARVAYCKALACNTSGKQVSARRAVQARIAHDDGLAVDEACTA